MPFFAPLNNLMSERKELYNNRVALFYLMKDLLLSASQPIAATLDQEMRNSPMAFVNGYPQWMDFAENLVRYRDKLVNLNCVVDETHLSTKFHNELYVCFSTNLGDRMHQDNLY
jgi:hypothetical protein